MSDNRITIRWHELAEEDFVEAVYWYKDKDPRVAEAFSDAIDHAVEMIVTAPERWPTHRYGTRRYVVRDYPYSVVYLVKSDHVFIVAVAHGRRRSGYWRKRLKP
ncbi:MAG: type II toxin-antitoxin system RelE/ParE family toxin [Phycisphaeraceae bacterium]